MKPGDRDYEAMMARPLHEFPEATYHLVPTEAFIACMDRYHREVVTFLGAMDEHFCYADARTQHRLDVIRSLWRKAEA